MPAPFPNPIPAWVKGAWHTVDTTLVEPYVSLLQYIENLSSDKSWMRVDAHFANSASGAVVQDDMHVTLEILNITGGLPDPSWITADFTSCEGKLDTFFNAMVANTPIWLTLSEYKWYVRSFNPLTTSKPFAQHGPPVRITSRSIAGANANPCAAQQAATVTKKTPWAKHWGRMYLPWGGGTTVNSAGGRLGTGQPAFVATAFQTLVESLASSDFQVVVPSVQVDKVPSRQLLTVVKTQVDDILDVHRSRRPRNPLVRAIKP